MEDGVLSTVSMAISCSGETPPINHQCSLFSASRSHPAVPPSLHFSLVLLAPSSHTDIIPLSQSPAPSAPGIS